MVKIAKYKQVQINSLSGSIHSTILSYFNSIQQSLNCAFKSLKQSHNTKHIKGYPKNLAPVVQTLNSAIHWINHYPLDNSIGFASVCPLDSDLSGGQRYPSFEQLEPGRRKLKIILTTHGTFI